MIFSRRNILAATLAADARRLVADVDTLIESDDAATCERAAAALENLALATEHRAVVAENAAERRAAGAAFASRELTEESKQDRPAVQVGDPFKEKLLLEACLELLATDAVAGIQDMGAAGLTCSTCETASRAGCVGVGARGRE